MSFFSSNRHFCLEIVEQKRKEESSQYFSQVDVNKDEKQVELNVSYQTAFLESQLMSLKPYLQN
jgi:hypothetical protein